MNHENSRVRLQAANALQNIGSRAAAVLPAIAKAAGDPDDSVRRAAAYTASTLQ